MKNLTATEIRRLEKEYWKTHHYKDDALEPILDMMLEMARDFVKRSVEEEEKIVRQEEPASQTGETTKTKD